MCLLSFHVMPLAFIMRHTHLRAVFKNCFVSITFEGRSTPTRPRETQHPTHIHVQPTAFLPLCQARYLRTVPRVLSAIYTSMRPGLSPAKPHKSGTIFKSDHTRIPPMMDTSFPTAKTHICKVPTEPTHINSCWPVERISIQYWLKCTSTACTLSCYLVRSARQHQHIFLCCQHAGVCLTLTTKHKLLRHWWQIGVLLSSSVVFKLLVYIAAFT